MSTLARTVYQYSFFSPSVSTFTSVAEDKSERTSKDGMLIQLAFFVDPEKFSRGDLPEEVFAKKVLFGADRYFGYGEIKASYTVIDGRLYVYDGFTVGMVFEGKDSKNYYKFSKNMSLPSINRHFSWDEQGGKIKFHI